MEELCLDSRDRWPSLPSGSGCTTRWRCSTRPSWGWRTCTGWRWWGWGWRLVCQQPPWQYWWHSQRMLSRSGCRQELGVDSTGINSKYKVAFAIKNDESLILEEFYMHTTVWWDNCRSEILDRSRWNCFIKAVINFLLFISENVTKLLPVYSVWVHSGTSSSLDIPRSGLSRLPREQLQWMDSMAELLQLLPAKIFSK